jgi:hypothetical protein
MIAAISRASCSIVATLARRDDEYSGAIEIMFRYMRAPEPSIDQFCPGRSWNASPLGQVFGNPKSRRIDAPADARSMTARDVVGRLPGRPIATEAIAIEHDVITPITLSDIERAN